MDNNEIIKYVEERIGYCFLNKDLLLQALTHSSYVNEMKINKRNDYERLEYLGDAVLQLMSGEVLFKKYPNASEGELSKKRASMVCEPSLAICARRMELGDAIFFGHGEEKTGGRNRDSVLCDVVESVLGAIYLDGGFDEAYKYANNHILDILNDSDLFVDSKSKLMELVVKEFPDKELVFNLVDSFGPDHNKTFVVEAVLDGIEMAVGKSNTKKGAEQNAAALVIEILKKRK